MTQSLFKIAPNTKVCCRCNQEFPIDNFYKRASSADGYRTDCKSCQIAYNREWREKNREKVREYFRSWRSTPEAKAKEKEYRTRVPKVPSLHKKARQAVNDYVRAGKIEKAETCQECGTSIGLQAHHENYHDPLNVIWLCGICHHKRHREINEEIRQNPKKWARRGFLVDAKDNAA